MDFGQIEKKIDPLILGYIKDTCYQKIYDRTTIERDGNRYTSRRIYKNIFNKEQYKKRVRDYYLKNVQVKEPAVSDKKEKKKKIEKGKNITQKEFFELIFRDHFDHRRGEKDGKGRRIYLKSFLFNIDSEKRVIEEKRVVRELQNTLQKAKKFRYFTPNLFISHKFFTKEMLSLLGVIVLDFDLDSHHKVMTKETLRKYIQKRLGVEPAMIWDTKTKGNFQAAILIEKMTGTPASVHLYEQIVKEMVKKLVICDDACASANHIFSIGQNNKRKEKYIRKYNETIHSIDAFRWLLLERDKRRERENKTIDFTQVRFKKHPAVAALFEGRVHFRDHAAFTLALIHRWLGRDKTECANFMFSEWLGKVNGPDFDHPFTPMELHKCIRHAYSGRYLCFHSKWIEITTGIDCDLSGYFRRKSDNKGIYITDTEKRFKEYLQAHNGVFVGKYDDLVKELGVKLRTLEHAVKQMKERNEIILESGRGRGARTTFRLAEEQYEKVIQQSFQPFEEEFRSIQNLEENVQQALNF